MPDEQNKSNVHTKEELLNIYTGNIVPMSIKGGSTQAKEIIDVLAEYTWNANSLSAGIQSGDRQISFSHNVPICYAIERQQTVNSTIANVINSINASIISIGEFFQTGAKTETGQTILNTGGDVVNRVQSLIPQKKDRETNGAKPTPEASNTETSTSETPDNPNKKETTQNAAEKFVGFIKSIQELYSSYVEKFKRFEGTNLNSDLLSPYKFLYFTKETGKKFVFPMLNFDEFNLLNLSHNYGDAKTAELPLIGGLTEIMGGKVLTFFSGATSLINTFADTGSARTEEHMLEMAKAFNFETGGQEVSSNFVLYNTIKKDAWKKHYRFLMSFLLRNLPFKITPYSYIPPLLYDIIIPGTKHLPLCYVSSITINPLGRIRSLTIEDFIKGIVTGTNASGTMLVAVPEAWKVSIKFKCLLSDTANLLLDLKNAPINVSSKVSSS